MKTVAHKNIASWWDGKVIIDEVREYVDPRGSLTELWRTDDDVMCEAPHCPTMSYWSITKPYVMRGPHQHANQTDWFYTFKSKMVYQLYNLETQEMKVYFTNPNAITRVKVAPPIIHSYRALDSKDVLTANFPSSLFMGENKKSPIDEIRWEEKFHDTPVIFIFGASGRLGKKVTNVFFQNMGFHHYEVVPCYEKLNNVDEVTKFMENLFTLFKGRKVYFINCAALTNVQDATIGFQTWEWINGQMPGYIANFCESNNWKFIGISTDYVYQSDESNLSNYTKSKKIFEKIVSNNVASGCIKILRVANLFSTAESDVHNIICKLKKSIKTNSKATIDPNAIVFPTDVQILAEKIYEMFNTKLFDDDKSYFNIIPKSYNLEEFIKRFFGEIEIIHLKSVIPPWYDDFMTDRNANIIRITTKEETIEEIVRR